MRSPYSLLVWPALAVSAAFWNAGDRTGRAHGEFRVLDSIALPGVGVFDFLAIDTLHRHLFVTRTTHIQVVDIDRWAVAADIPNTPDVHGVAIATALGRGFSSNAGDSSVLMFDLGSLQALARIKIAGAGVDGIVFDPASRRVLTINGKSGTATAIDGRSGKIVGQIDVGGYGESPTSDGRGQIYVSIKDHNQIAVIDAAKMRVTARWPLVDCDEPHGISLYARRGRLLVSCQYRSVIIDLTTGRILGSVGTTGIGDQVAFDASRALTLVPGGGDNGDSLMVIPMNVDRGYQIAQTIKTLERAQMVVVDGATHRAFTVGYEPGQSGFANRPATALVLGK
jgi:DNA-binding beta-propeller fold protein YncE